MSDFAADPRAMVRAVRQQLAENEAERRRLTAELKQWEERADVRPADGSDQPGLFEAAAQPKLW